MTQQSRLFQVFLRDGESFLAVDTRPTTELAEAFKLGGLVVFTGDPTGAGSAFVNASDVMGVTTMVMPNDGVEDGEGDIEEPEGFEDDEEPAPEPTPAAKKKLGGLRF